MIDLKIIVGGEAKLNSYFKIELKICVFLRGKKENTKFCPSGKDALAGNKTSLTPNKDKPQKTKHDTRKYPCY